MGNLHLPKKKSFRNRDKDFMERRKQDLDLYLQVSFKIMCLEVLVLQTFELFNFRDSCLQNFLTQILGCLRSYQIS